MRLDGIHHVTCITADAPRNVDFYTRVLGLRLVKKTVNQDDPTVYHLFYADEAGTPGSDITFFEYPGARRGRAGAGMVHRVVWRVGSEQALDFWADRLGTERADGSLLFKDPEGLEHELVVDESGEEPLMADHPEIPEEHRLRGFAGVRVYSSAPERSAPFLEELGFEPGWVVRGGHRSGLYVFDPPPPRIDKFDHWNLGTYNSALQAGIAPAATRVLSSSADKGCRCTVMSVRRISSS